MNHRIRVELREYNRNGIEAIATVTVDGSIRFLVNIRSYQDQDTKEQKYFFAYPRRKQGEEWQNVLRLEEELRKEVETAIGEALKEEVLNELHLPDITGVTVIPVNQRKERQGNMIIRGIADVQFAGITIKGITIKETQQGYLVNMPQYQNAEGQFRDMVYSTSSQLRRKIRDEILEEYERRIKEASGK